MYFQALADEGDIKAGDIVLYLDTLKVSTIENTAESVDARGGWGENISKAMWIAPSLKNLLNCWNILRENQQPIK